MSQFDTKKLYDLLNTLEPKKNYLLLNDPGQNSRFDDYWDDEIDEKYKKYLTKHGDNAKCQLIALVTRDEEVETMRELVEAIPATLCLFGKPVTEEDRYHCRIIFVNCELEAFFGIGLGRKTTVFEKGPFLADGSDLNGGIEKFAEIDFSDAINNIYDSLVAAGSALDELANVDYDDEDDEVEIDIETGLALDEVANDDLVFDADVDADGVGPVGGSLSEAISDLNDYLDLEVVDIENDNH